MRKLINYFTRPIGLELVRPLAVKSRVRHQFLTYAYSQEDQAPNQTLVSLALAAIERAFEEKVDTSGCNPQASDFQHFNEYPGEHYRLLRALTSCLNPRTAVEIGTFTGMGTTSIHQGLSEQSEIATFDIVKWDTLETHLSLDIFNSSRLTQYLSDLSIKENFIQFKPLLSKADLIFCDGPKNGKFELAFLSLLKTLPASQGTRVLVLDDIHFPNMIDLWRSIRSPKLDITSFGHFSGTGLVDLSKGLELSPD
jgi:predicted O-methyltransferase YrrM